LQAKLRWKNDIAGIPNPPSPEYEQWIFGAETVLTAASQASVIASSSNFAKALAADLFTENSAGFVFADGDRDQRITIDLGSAHSVSTIAAAFALPTSINRARYLRLII